MIHLAKKLKPLLYLFDPAEPPPRKYTLYCYIVFPFAVWKASHD
jgi:hypothetical protein